MYPSSASSQAAPNCEEHHHNRKFGGGQDVGKENLDMWFAWSTQQLARWSSFEKYKVQWDWEWLNLVSDGEDNIGKNMKWATQCGQQLDMAKYACWVNRIAGQKRVILNGFKMGSGQLGYGSSWPVLFTWFFSFFK